MRDLALKAAAGTLLLLAGLPGAVGHDDLWYSSGGSDSRYPGDVKDGVAGTYVGTNGAHVPPGDPTGWSLCKMEVYTDGFSQPLDETWVNGHATVGIIPPVPGGQVPDGTWDDGGHGGACHVNSFSHDDYNSPGCTDDFAHADDGVSGGDVWIATACDWMTDEGDGGLGVYSPSEEYILLCLLNKVILGGDAESAVPCVLECILADCTVGIPENCGADGIPDGMNFGTGGSGVPYPYDDTPSVDFGISFDSWYCQPYDAAMAVYVFNAVEGGTVRTATSGTIWQED